MPLNLSTRAFWDINLTDLDLEKHGVFILGRIMRYGTVEDWRMLKKYYGLERIKDLAKGAKELDVFSISFLCADLNLKQEELKCCTQDVFPKSFWSF